jgi:hypothetical protein
LHGFDACGGFWHGPTEIEPLDGRPGPILSRLLNSPGNFHGKLTHRLPGSPRRLSFQAAIYNLHDSGLAVIDFEGSDGGPAAVLTVIPANRRPVVRPEFAFEFVSFWHFAANHRAPDAEMAVHDYIESTLKAEPGRSLAFSVECHPGESDANDVLAACIEDLAAAMHQWLAAKDADALRETACA